MRTRFALLCSAIPGCLKGMSSHAVVKHRTQAAANSVLPLTAIIAVVLGTGIYIFERDWAAVLFLMPWADGQPGPAGWLGPLAYTLPAFLHAYAFALLIMLALPPSRLARRVGALSWLFVAAGLECLQSEYLKGLITDGSGSLAGIPPVDSLLGYIMNGRFDAADLLATALGVLVAYVASSVQEKRQ